MKTRPLIWAAICASFVIATACEDDDNDLRTLSGADQTFVQEAAMASMATQQVSELATTNTTDTDVQTFAQNMFYEHGLALHELRQLAKNYSNANLPTEIDSANREVKDTLTMLTGDDFNLAYARHLLESNQKVKTLYENAANSASDNRLKAFAAKYVSMMTENLNAADSLVRMFEEEEAPAD